MKTNIENLIQNGNNKRFLLNIYTTIGSLNGSYFTSKTRKHCAIIFTQSITIVLINFHS